MYLEKLIAFLETRDPTIVVLLGFHAPHSYRGFYEQLAFEPLENTTIGIWSENYNVCTLSTALSY